MSLVAVYASIEICEAKENDIYHLKLNSMLHPCPCCDVLIVSGDFNTVTGTERAGYVLCIGPHCSFTRNENSTFFFNLAKFRRLIHILGIRDQCCIAELDTAISEGCQRILTISLLVLVGGSSRTALFFWSAEFYVNDLILVDALKLHVKSRKALRCVKS